MKTVTQYDYTNITLVTSHVKHYFDMSLLVNEPVFTTSFKPFSLNASDQILPDNPNHPCVHPASDLPLFSLCNSPDRIVSHPLTVISSLLIVNFYCYLFIILLYFYSPTAF